MSDGREKRVKPACGSGQDLSCTTHLLWGSGCKLAKAGARLACASGRGCDASGSPDCILLRGRAQQGAGTTRVGKPAWVWAGQPALALCLPGEVKRLRFPTTPAFTSTPLGFQ